MMHFSHFDIYKKYLKLKKCTEQFFDQKNYVKVELPLLSPALIPESYVEVFTTEFHFLSKRHKLYLTPSPELFMKRLLADGIGDCYYLDKAFRNSEPESSLHLPEFTLLEFYKVGVNYEYIKKEVQQLLYHLVQMLHNKSYIVYKGKKIELRGSCEELSVEQAFERFAQISPDSLFDEDQLKNRAKDKGYAVENFSYVDVFSQIYTQEIEPCLGTGGKPTILYNYPREMAALAKLNKDGKTAQRFELYIAGVELGDCYSELTDWKEQETRFHQEIEDRERMGKSDYTPDWGFISALKKGLPECSGMALGFERLAMVFLGCDDIRKLKLITINE